MSFDPQANVLKAKGLKASALKASALKANGLKAKIGRLSSICSITFVSSTLVFSTSSCGSSSKTQDQPGSSNGGQTLSTPGETWPAKMQALSQTLGRLLPMVASRTKFADPKNSASIEADTRVLSELAHSLKTTDAPSADPSLRMVGGLFEEDIARALDAMRSGNRDYARLVLRDTTSYCIQCHTQTNNGPNFPRLELGVNINEFSPLEQAEFYTATRQFDSALTAYRDVLNQASFAKGSPFEWENAARAALAITVRVKGDAKQTSALIKEMLSNSGLSSALRKTVLAWQKTVEDWAKEKPAPNASVEDQLKLADNLINRAEKSKIFPLDHTQDIPYFRASSLLHDLLQTQATLQGRSLSQTAQALYLAGVSSEATRDLNFWTLHETYYEQCIRAKPKSELARKCFNRLNESITLGFSGSAGTKIPPDVARRLEGFRQLAY